MRTLYADKRYAQPHKLQRDFARKNKAAARRVFA